MVAKRALEAVEPQLGLFVFDCKVKGDHVWGLVVAAVMNDLAVVASDMSGVTFKNGTSSGNYARALRIMTGCGGNLCLYPRYGSLLFSMIAFAS